MRRFSKFIHVRNISRVQELEFLQQTPVPSKNTNAASTFVSLPVDTHDDDNSPSQSEYFIGENTTKGIKYLSAFVGKRQYDKAFALFNRMPKLYGRPQAVRLLLKAFCEQHDFVSAKALFNKNIDMIGDEFPKRYIAHLTFNARNVDLIEEAFNSLCNHHHKNKTTIPPSTVAAVLYGLLFLENKPAFDRVWRRTSNEFWNPSLKSTTLCSGVLDFMIKEDWVSAQKTWNIAAAMNNFDFKESLRLWFVALMYFLVENPNADAIQNVITMIKNSGAVISPKFSNMILNQFCRNPSNATKTPVDWLSYASSQDFHLDSACVEDVVRNYSRRFPKSMAEELLSRTVGGLEKYGLVSNRKASLERNASNNIFRFRSQPNMTAPEILTELHDAEKKGVCLSYQCLTDAFERICMNGDLTNEDLSKLIGMFKSYGYSLHNSSTDLSILKVHYKKEQESTKQTNQVHTTIQSLIHVYLMQYPLVSLDLYNRTRLAQLIMEYGADYNLALAILDSVRSQQIEESSDIPGSNKFSFANHDNASLQTMLYCKAALSEPIVPFIREILANNSDIYFDEEFKSVAHKLVLKNNENLGMLHEINSSNAKQHSIALMKIDETVLFYRDLVSNSISNSSLEPNNI